MLRMLSIGLACLLVVAGCNQKPNKPTDKRASARDDATHKHNDNGKINPIARLPVSEQDPDSSGASLYQTYCQSCHGLLAQSSKLGSSFDDIKAALSQIPSMQGIELGDKDISAIAKALKTPASFEAFSCEDDASPPIVASSIRPLSKSEYINTLETLFSDFISMNELSVEFASIPESAGEFDTQELSLTANHFLAYDKIAKKLAQNLSNQVNFVERAFGSNCASNWSDACTTRFAQGFASRILRKPLTAGDLSLATEEISGAEKIQGLLHGLLISPDFLFHMQAYGEPTSEEGVYKLSSFELASRLSYAIWADMPDETLFELAKSNSLQDESTWKEQIKRLLAHPKARKQNAKFYVDWLKLDEILNYNPSEKSLAGLDIDSDLSVEILEEAKRFVNNITFEQSGGLNQLLSSTETFTNSSTYAKLLEGGQRPGILWRLILANSRFSEKRDLIHSGLIIRSHLLCENLPSPPAELNDEVQKAVDRQLTNMSSRRKVEIKTESPSCSGCHTKINPLAFASANHYDSVGRFIEEESFETNGVIKRFPIDSFIEDPAIDFPGEASLEGPAQLANRLASSERASACLVQKRYASILGRKIQAEAKFDGCSLKRAHKALGQAGSGGLLNMLEALLGPELRYRKPL